MQDEEEQKEAAEARAAAQDDCETGAAKEQPTTKVERSQSTEHSTNASSAEEESSSEEQESADTFDASSDDEELQFSSSESEEASDRSTDNVRRPKARNSLRYNRRLVSAPSSSKQKKPSASGTSKTENLDAADSAGHTVVGLRVEDFFPTNDANALIKQALGNVRVVPSWLKELHFYQ